MRLHANAALTLNQRERMVRRVVDDGWSLAKAARAAEVSDRTCSKWVARYGAAGRSGLTDRSSAPHRVANRTDEQTVQLLVALRRLRFTAPELAGAHLTAFCATFKDGIRVTDDEATTTDEKVAA